jgi:NAD(P)-dependent dehydrogenase (short-subunit alcohol dehydrogenase family)
MPLEGVSNMRILITGGTGFLERATVRELAGAGHTAHGPLPEADRLDLILDRARSVDTTCSTRDRGLACRPLRETLSDTIRWWSRKGRIDPGLAVRFAGSTPARGTA